MNDKKKALKVKTSIKASGLCGSYCPNHNRQMLRVKPAHNLPGMSSSH